jgi:hypothetical protein
LGDQECWPERENIDFNSILQLDLFYRKERKPKHCRKCYTHAVLLATLQALAPDKKKLKKKKMGKRKWQ